MEKIIIYFSLGLLFIFNGCKEDSESLKSDFFPPISDESVQLIQETIKEATMELKEKAWTGETFNQQQQEVIISKYFGNDYLGNFQLKSFGFDELKLTERQKVVYDELLNMIGNKQFNVEDAISLIEGLSYEEKEVFYYSIYAFNSIIKGFLDAGVLNEDINLKSASTSTFICNLTTGGVGSIYGAWAGALLGGPAGIGVALITSALLSTLVC